MGKQGVKGMLLMAVCCGAPLLILLVLPLAGTALGGLGASALTTLALLACPIGMGLMMWMMMRGQRAETPASGPSQPDVPVQETRAASEPLPGASVLPDRSETEEATETSPPLAQVELVTPPRRGRDQQPAAPAAASNGQQVAAPTPERNDTQTATSSHA